MGIDLDEKYIVDLMDPALRMRLLWLSPVYS